MGFTFYCTSVYFSCAAVFEVQPLSSPCAWVFWTVPVNFTCQSSWSTALTSCRLTVAGPAWWGTTAHECAFLRFSLPTSPMPPPFLSPSCSGVFFWDYMSAISALLVSIQWGDRNDCRGGAASMMLRCFFEFTWKVSEKWDLMQLYTTQCFRLGLVTWIIVLFEVDAGFGARRCSRSLCSLALRWSNAH